MNFNEQRAPICGAQLQRLQIHVSNVVWHGAAVIRCAWRMVGCLASSRTLPKIQKYSNSRILGRLCYREGSECLPGGTTSHAPCFPKSSVDNNIVFDSLSISTCICHTFSSTLLTVKILHLPTHFHLMLDLLKL